MKATHSKRTGRFVRRPRPIKRRTKKRATRDGVTRILSKLVPKF